MRRRRRLNYLVATVHGPPTRKQRRTGRFLGTNRRARVIARFHLAGAPAEADKALRASLSQASAVKRKGGAAGTATGPEIPARGRPEIRRGRRRIMAARGAATADRGRRGTGVGGVWHCPPHAAPPPRHRKGSEDLCVFLLRFSHERGIDG